MSSLYQRMPNELRAKIELHGKRVSLVDIAHEALRDAIVTLNLQPAIAVTEVQLANELGVSRSILREAVQRLQADGLVLREGNGRLRISPMSSKDIHDLYAVRSAMEQVAVVEVISRITPEQVESLDETLNQLQRVKELGSPGQIAKAGGALHHLILEIADNAIINQVMDVLRLRIERYRNLSSSSIERPSNSLREHQRIVEAIRCRDIEAARKAIAIHIEASERAALSAFKNNARHAEVSTEA